MSKIVAFMGAKDGVGASTSAYQFAQFLRRKDEKVLLLDWDASFLGDLKNWSGDQNPWRSLTDLGDFSQGFQLFTTMQLARCKSDLHALNPSAALKNLEKISPSFDWIIADIGSRWNKFSTHFLSRTDFLILILQSRIDLIYEAKRKCEELVESFFPLKRVGWFANFWDENSFLTKEAVSRHLQIESLEGTIADCIHPIRNLPILNGDLSSFRPQFLIPQDLSVVAVALAQETQKEKPFKADLLKAIRSKLDLKTIQGREQEIQSEVSKIIKMILEEESQKIPPDVDKEILVQELFDDLLKLGPLEGLLSDPNISEILVNGCESIYVEEAGKLKRLPQHFLDRDSLHKVIERILWPLGKRLDESSPMVDARLQDGSRVHIVIGPLAVDGPAISIRRFSKKIIHPQDMIRLGSANQEMLDFLQRAVSEKLNILISGGTGSGKTTLLNLLSSYIPESERIITIEEACELKLNQPHTVRLEARPMNVEGKGEITIRDLVKTSLRLRPDRIVVGEVRGAESLDMLQAMNTGHEGSLTTLHANTPRDALRRLETLVLFSGIDFPLRAIQEQIVSAIDLILQIARFPDGVRRIVSIVKVAGLEGETYTLENLFHFEKGEFKKCLF